VAMASHAITIPGHSPPFTHSPTADAAILIPAQAGLIAFTYIHRPAAAIPSHAATIPGHRTSLIQSHTTTAALLIAGQIFAHSFWPVSVLVKNQTRAATTAVIAIMTRPTGPVSAVQAARAAVASPDSAGEAATAAVKAAQMPGAAVSRGATPSARSPPASTESHVQLSLIHSNAVLIFSPISGSFSIAPTRASPIGPMSGVICSMSGSITSPKAT